MRQKEFDEFTTSECNLVHFSRFVLFPLLRRLLNTMNDFILAFLCLMLEFTSFLFWHFSFKRSPIFTRFSISNAFSISPSLSLSLSIYYDVLVLKCSISVRLFIFSFTVEAEWKFSSFAFLLCLIFSFSIYIFLFRR